MHLYRGIFWYNPNKHSLISVKVKCNENGEALEKTDGFKELNHDVEWAKLPESVTLNHPYNYYPRGRVEIKNNEVTITLNSVLLKLDIQELILEVFEISGKPITTKTVADESYNYLIDFKPTKCNMCGRLFDECDYEQNFSFNRLIGYGSKYDLTKINLNLCCDCFDKVLDWIIPQCKIDPLEEFL